ncbi:MAG: hypothetical protein J6M08_04410 [Methanobrevibacter sp.]|nr:hypothetical protein [Methanobrevibacter sp.]
MPTRFGHDIRRVWLSTLIITGQISRDEALEILKKPALTEDESRELFSEVARRLQISEDELWQFHKLPECTDKFKSQRKLYNWGIELYEKLGLERRIRK